MKGIIVSSICGTYKVLIKGQEYNVTARGLFKHHKRKLIVGDYVEIDEKEFKSVDEIEYRNADGECAYCLRRVAPVSGDCGREDTHERYCDARYYVGYRYAENLFVHRRQNYKKEGKCVPVLRNLCHPPRFRSGVRCGTISRDDCGTIKNGIFRILIHICSDV